jgi:hypothetical protein
MSNPGIVIPGAGKKNLGPIKNPPHPQNNGSKQSIKGRISSVNTS